jgi:hypothetical protein
VQALEAAGGAAPSLPPPLELAAGGVPGEARFRAVELEAAPAELERETHALARGERRDPRAIGGSQLVRDGAPSHAPNVAKVEGEAAEAAV